MKRPGKTPKVWMEARCNAICDDERWSEDCYQTSGGGFHRSIRTANKDFLEQGWKLHEGGWYCPVCQKGLDDEIR